MRIEARFSLGPREVGRALFDEMWNRFPEFRTQTPGGPVLRFVIPTGDPRLGSVQQILSRAGFVPWENHFRAALPNEYAIRLERIYGPADWDAAEFLIPRPAGTFARTRTDDRGRVRVQADVYENRTGMNADIAGDPVKPQVYVSAPIRTAFEAARLDHLVFEEALLAGEDPDTGEEALIPWPDPPGHRWTLTSDLVLPPAVHDNMVTRKGERYAGDSSGGCLLHEGLYTSSELRYRRAVLAHVPLFGLALTNELFGPVVGNRRLLIASRSFYEVCKRLNLAMNWQPVRVDD